MKDKNRVFDFIKKNGPVKQEDIDKEFGSRCTCCDNRKDDETLRAVQQLRDEGKVYLTVDRRVEATANAR